MSNEKIIWFDKSLSNDDLKAVTPGTLGEHLGMEWVSIGSDFLQMKMPVDKRTHQPYGILHGGASCALAETVGSVASHLVVDSKQFYCVGLEINANHVKSISFGWVIGTARPLHLGRSTHVWDIKITDENNQLICVSRLTVAVLPKNSL